MTIADNYEPIIELGNGSTVIFSGDWAVLSASYIRVNLKDVDTGVLTPQTQGVNYDLEFSDEGFSVEFYVAPTSDYEVIISRDVDITQEEPFRTQKGFQGERDEDAYDKLTAICQDIKEEGSRALRYGLGSTTTDTTVAEPVDDAALAFDGVTGKIKAGPTTADIANAAANAAAAAASAAAAAASAASAAGIYDNVVTRTANFTVLTADEATLFQIDCTSGNVTATLSTIADLGQDFKVAFSRIVGGGNTVTIAAGSGNTINGSPTFSLSAIYDNATLIANAGDTNWLAIGGSSAVVPDASTTVKGKVELATSAETITGSDTARAVTPAGLAAALAAAPSFTVARQVFTSSGTYTPTSGMKYADVEIVGGGGNGGSSPNNGRGGGGGGSGGYSKKIITAATIGASQSVTIGGATGTSSFGSILTANGGASGSGSVAGGGGTASGGDINITGGQGTDGAEAGNIGANGGGGSGGSSFFGGAGGGDSSPSGGGGGSASANSGSGGGGSNENLAPGGNGAGGICIITEYL